MKVAVAIIVVLAFTLVVLYCTIKSIENNK